MKYDIVIVGAGVIGASIAYNLIPYDVSVLLLDKNNDVAMGSTRANSAIIHAGFDPKPGTLMAKLNVEGNQRCEKLCADLSVPFSRCGSLVLAFSEKDKVLLQELLDRGNANGVPDLRIISSEELHEMEPSISEEAIAALYAPSAGIVNPWELCLAQAEVFVRNGGTFLGNCKVTGIRKSDNRYILETTQENIEANTVILACGVYSDIVHGFVSEPDFRIVPTRGEYYLLDKSEGSRVGRVIFQCPDENGKGILVSPTVHGNLICGPTAEILKGDPEDTSTTAEKLAEVKAKAALSVKDISWRDNIRNFSGIRANSTAEDFIIRRIPEEQGIFEAAGIKSPGLASSPAIGPYMVDLLKDSGISLPEKASYDLTRKKIHFRDLSNEERAELVKKDSAYGRIVCRCEGITEGEIRDALNSPIPPVSLDAVKRRAGTGMGRCQGGFCGPRIVEMLIEQSRNVAVPCGSTPLPPAHLSILQDANGSNLFFERDAEKEVES
ncbi:MAG: NAD(P)/FAD-dependent oxidoreductase [Clostridiales bacterium]|nr:NAD(P)/FAD-dependent oxidoreductase [Clostridiales bacterium]MBR4011146.1 NAD(P)/FAD-dependent oxidoreductase [Clostridiales bacterium]